MALQSFVPQEWCLTCRRCCRFADPRDAQTPAFSLEEVRRAAAHGGAVEWFQPSPQPPSQAVRVTPHPCGGAQCPALEPTRHHCRIYPSRPLDCELYPFVLTRDGAGHRLLLSVDTKCPYIQQLGPGRAVREYGRYLQRLLEAPEGQRALTDNPGLAGRPRDEFWTVSPILDPSPPAVPPPPAGFVPLVSRWGEFDEMLEQSGRPLSAYHRASWAAWQDLLRLWWGPLGAHRVLLVEQGGGYFLGLPPLGAPLTPEAMEEVFVFLSTLNGGTPVSRIENLPEDSAALCRAWGYAVRPVEQEYVYERARLERQAASSAGATEGDGVTIRPYRPEDLEACLEVYASWALTRQSEIEATDARAMLRDGFYAHRRWLAEAVSLGIRGWVADGVEGICGYALGMALSAETCVVLAEVTTLSHEGLGARLTTALSRAFTQPFVNVMGDAGLPALARRKLADEPCAIQPVFSAARPS